MNNNEIRYYTLSEKLIADSNTHPKLWLPAEVHEHYVLATMLGKIRGLDLPGHRAWLEYQWEEYAIECADERECPDCGGYMDENGRCEQCEKGFWRFGPWPLPLT